jgi:diguanylate cyclase (GGDEF)-like protein
MAGFARAEVLRRDGDAVWTLCAKHGSHPESDGVGDSFTLEPGHIARRAVDSGIHRWAVDQLAIPIISDGKAWGAVVLTRRGGISLAASSAERADAIVELGALIIAYKESRARLRVAASTDPLTGLPHKDRFFEQFEREMARAMRTGAGLSVVKLEIDNFGRVLEEYGREVADRMLADVGRVLDSEVRRDEMISRVGDHVFAWLIAGADRVTSTIAAQRALSAISEAEELRPFDLSLSAGIADIAYANDAPGMARRAHEALNWAKVMGRGMIAHYSPEGPVSSGGSGLAEARREFGTAKSRAPVAALLRTLEAVDRVAARHSERVGELAAQIAAEMGWSETLIGAIRDAGCLHDIGMLCIPNSILGKPGRLTKEEFDRVKEHTVLGAELAAKIVMPAQAAWIRGHHERWDGLGYPDGLEGEEIPEGAAILAMADAWDTMTTARTYAPLREPEEAMEEIRKELGFQFAPYAVEGLERVVKRGAVRGLLGDGLPELSTLGLPSG